MKKGDFESRVVPGDVPTIATVSINFVKSILKSKCPLFLKVDFPISQFSVFISFSESFIVKNINPICRPTHFRKKSIGMDKLSVDMMMGSAMTVIIYGTRFKVYYYKYKQLLAFNTFNFLLWYLAG